MNKKLFTMGYGKIQLPRFIELLKQKGIRSIIDVRTAPYSRYKPEFSKKELEKSLKQAGLNYLFMGKECGGHPADGGFRDYKEYGKTAIFKQGLKRILEVTAGGPACLMCAESDPLKCHRFLLVCRHLRQTNLIINHLYFDGNEESQRELEVRLLEAAGLAGEDFFMTEEERLLAAYDKIRR